MPKNISKELEKAILALPTKEKERLLLRLIAKNQLLLEQLDYTLVAEESDLDIRREELNQRIKEEVSKSYLNIVLFTKALRKQSAAVTWHRRVTKDKYGELEGQLLLVETTLTKQRKYVSQLTKKGDSLRLYLVKKTISLLKLTEGIHEDFLIDFSERINQLLKLLYTFETSFYAHNLKLQKTFGE